MPQLHLSSGPSHGYYFYESRIVERLKRGQFDFLALLPVNRAVRQLLPRLIDANPRGVIAGSPVSTFNDFLLQLYRSRPFSRSVIAREQLHFLIEEILQRRAGELRYLTSSGQPPRNLVRKLGDMVSELRRFGYTAEKLSAQEASAIDVEEERLTDFLLVMRELENILGDRYIDTDSARHRAAVELQKEDVERNYPGLQHIFIAGYGMFTPAMIAAIEKLSGWYDVHLKLDHVEENSALFRHTRPALQRFRQIAAEESTLTSGLLAKRLFNRERKTVPFPAGERFMLMKAENRRSEVQRMAREIRRLVQNGSSHSEIAITFPNLEMYVPHIRAIFSDYGIPFNLSTGYKLSQSPLISLLLRLLTTIAESFDYSRVLQLWQSPFLKNNCAFSKGLLHKELIKCRIRYLREGWPERLLDAYLRREGDNPRHKEQLSEEAAMLKEFLQPLYRFGSGARPVGEFRRDYLALLKELHALEWYKAQKAALSQREQEQEFRAYNAFMKLLDQFFWSMRLLHGEKKLPLADWIAHLQTAVSAVTYNLTEWPHDAVQIMPRLEILAVPQKVLMLGGLVDGDFPRGSAADLFFDDAARSKLGLLASEELLDQDRFMFYSLLDGEADTVYLSMPRYEGEKALVPSTFLADLQECAAVSEVPDDDEQSMYGLEELQAAFGSAVLQRQSTFAAQHLRSMARDTFSRDDVADLLRRLEAAGQRLALDGDPRHYEGVLGAFKETQLKLKENFAKKPWSITRLEEYAFCPMQFFNKRVMRLEEWPQFEEEVSPLERGSVMHTILYRFYSLLRERGETENPLKALDSLKKIAREELQRLPFEGFFWELEKRRYFGDDSTPGLLEKMLQVDSEAISVGLFVPSFFEFSFGPAYDTAIDPASVEQCLELSDDSTTMLVNGKVDRIDIHEEKGQALLFDYKTGSINAKSAKEIAKGLSFQLPLYVLAVEQLLLKNKSVVAAGYFQVKDADHCQRKEAIADKESYSGTGEAFLPSSVKIDGQKVGYNELINFTRDKALQMHRTMLSADFRHTSMPDHDRCGSYCDYKRMCQKYVTKLLHQRRKAAENDNKDGE